MDATVTPLDWTARSACRKLADYDSVFFGFDGERPEVQAGREAEAKAVCKPCPVRLRCLLHALRTGSAHGVFGGHGEQERAVMKRNGGWDWKAAS